MTLRLMIMLGAIVLTALYADLPLHHAVRQLPPEVRVVFEYITELGLSFWVFICVGGALLLCWYARRKRFSPRYHRGSRAVQSSLFFIGGAVALTGITAAIFKQILGRARPKLLETHGVLDFELFAFSHKQASFPSGHTTSIFALAMALALLMPRWRGVFFAVAALVGASRVVVGAHWTSDVLAGAALGCIGTWLLARYCAGRGWVFNPDLTLHNRVLTIAICRYMHRNILFGWISNRRK